MMPLQRGARLSLLGLTLAYVALMMAGGTNVRTAFQVPHDSVMATAFVGPA